MNGLFRIARITRLYKLMKLARLLRMIKLIKEQAKILKILNEFLKVSPGFERLYFFLLLFILMNHIIACMWIMQPQFSGKNPNPDLFYEGTWLEPFYI